MPTKPKVNKTIRILTTDGAIYTSSYVVSELNGHLMRAENNRMMIRKGEYNTVIKKLKEFAKTHPNHFTNEGRIWILDKYCAGA